ncbi:RNA-binding domain-containing protein [Xylona heveae TC161]|uniref:RNA-binding domain-containing protein n=1 Tax=Xylona heveae (strain CBS 132557 / TC161) TaxID=1328760 RepID=A0A165IL33_XYLHT|nr:RNA-binding domain-containing protein [Xylona heveae TC161]KZF25053.1 RNA-binding domain-containing protein [Xylona heveae TC161]
MEYENEPRGYEDEPRYERDRSLSPRPARRGDSPRRDRSASPNGRMDSRGPPPDSRNQQERDDSARNPGSNLFVTGIHPRLSEAEVARLFEKYGDVEKCAIMLDPHTKESRGFGFVKMVTAEQADAAKEGLQGEVIEGRTLSIEKARRARPRTPTPGKYFGPPKREDRPPRRFGGRYEDRRGGYGGGYGGYSGYGRRDDPYSYRGSRYEEGDRYYGRREPREDYAPRGVDRYASGREDRYGGRGEDRRGGYERDSAARSGSYAEPPAAREPREPYASRTYDDRADDRYSRR